MEGMYEFLADSPHREFKKGDKCIILGFTYQDCGPIAWARHLDSGYMVGTNPSNLKFVKEREV